MMSGRWHRPLLARSFAERTYLSLRGGLSCSSVQLESPSPAVELGQTQ